MPCIPEDAINWGRFNANASDMFEGTESTYAIRCTGCNEIFICNGMMHMVLGDAANPKEVSFGLTGNKCPHCGYLWFTNHLGYSLRDSVSLFFWNHAPSFFPLLVNRKWSTVNVSIEDIRNSEWRWILR